jgi:hypothetical protein
VEEDTAATMEEQGTWEAVCWGVSAGAVGDVGEAGPVERLARRKRDDLVRDKGDEVAAFGWPDRRSDSGKYKATWPNHVQESLV